MTVPGSDASQQGEEPRRDLLDLWRQLGPGDSVRRVSRYGRADAPTRYGATRGSLDTPRPDAQRLRSNRIHHP